MDNIKTRETLFLQTLQTLDLCFFKVANTTKIFEIYVELVILISMYRNFWTGQNLDF